MPDRRRQRGPHPKDRDAFADSTHPTLRRAVAELSWLLTRDYSYKASVTIVGDRYALTSRQRKALQRCASSDEAVARRRAKELTLEEVSGREVWVDGYNVLLTVEAALSGGLVLVARDGALRDLAALSRHYKKVETTRRAVGLLGEALARAEVGSLWLFDRPISNSARLCQLIDGIAEEHSWEVQAELHSNPDAALVDFDGPVATADGAILDRCTGWLNLARIVVEQEVPDAWVLDLS